MIDLVELQRALSNMRPRQKLYELVKAEMKKRGRWKNQARGRSFVSKQERDDD